MIIIPEAIKSELKFRPEYGMGFQVVTIRLSTGSYESGIILNGSVFIKTNEVANKTYEIFLEEAIRESRWSSLSVSSASLTPRPESTLKGVRRVQAYGAYVMAANQAAESAEITQTKYGEIFKRFSAYINDFRVTAKMGLTPGTFATTEEDAKNVHTGMEAVARYALQNKDPANKVFTIKPLANTNLKQGVAQPAYGEPGGGVEVIFVDGSPDYTVTGPTIIRER